jgi:hypothetical protein
VTLFRSSDENTDLDGDADEEKPKINTWKMTNQV